MRTLRFKVSGQELIRAPGCDFSNIIAGTSGYLQAAFEFGQDWDGTIQVAAFYPYLQSREVGRLIKDGTCIVPDEITVYDTFKIGVVGQRENGQRITTNLITIKQERGSGQAWQR
ncbi:MAG: hypothetical protein E6749_17550 [Enterocloster clostridioformis]|uniref:hypothetical protein n=1 Tax=Enterocloster clostridioformis TaxID=1531 RepID=UPI00290535A0|nr:hypothetical protein [Enterocloster clostridioformis]MDU1962194.1 hypothetical protein [Enterocloster clostridioformis]